VKIIFVSQYFPPEVCAPANRTYEHAKQWIDVGHNVTVITGFPNHPDGIVHEGYRGEFLRRETIDGIDVVRTWLYAAPNAGFVGRVANYLTFAASAVLSGALFTTKPDIVAATSPQFFVGLSGLALSRWFDVPHVLEIRDLWPESAIELGAISDPVTITVLETLETMMYRGADRTVIVSESFRDHISGRGIPSDDIELIPNGISPDFLDDRRDVDVSAKHDLDAEFLVGYVGTHGMAHGLDKVLDAAERLADQNVDFLFVGDGARKDDLVAEAERRELDNVDFVGLQPRETIPSFYEACDICLVPLRDKDVFKTVLPSKMFEIMALGRPMIVSVGGEAQRVVEREDAGVCVEPENVEEMIEAIRDLKESPEKREKLGEKAKEYVWEEFSRPALADKYLEVFRKVVD